MIKTYLLRNYQSLNNLMLANATTELKKQIIAGFLEKHKSRKNKVKDSYKI